MSFWSFGTGGGGGPHAHDAEYVNEGDHTKAVHDALAINAGALGGAAPADFVLDGDHTTGAHNLLGIDAATLQGLAAAAFALAGHTHMGLGNAIVKAADFDRTNTVAYAADPELSFPVGLNETWIYFGVAFYNGPLGADIKFRPRGPNNCSIRLGRVGMDPADAAQPALMFSDVATEAAGELGCATYGAGARIYASLDGIAQSTDTAGDVTLEVAQITANAVASILEAKSYIVPIRIA